MRWIYLVAIGLLASDVAAGQPLLFKDDFTNGFSEKWYNTNGWVALGGKAYCYDVSPRSPIYVGQAEWYDYSASLDYMPLGDPASQTPEFELYFYSQSNSNFDNCYRCDFYQTTIRLCQYLNGRWSNLGSVSHGYTINFNVWYRLDVEKFDNSFRARVYPLNAGPSEWQLMINNAQFRLGSVAVSGFQTQCYVDNVVVSGLELDTGPVSALGGYYELRHFDGIWEEAYVWAQSLASPNGASHLATVVSPSEQQGIEELFDYSVVSPFLGGYQDHSANEPSDGWAWCTGEVWGFEAWLPGSPDQQSGDEDYLVLLPEGWDDRGTFAPAWYLIEYDEEPVGVVSKSWGEVKAQFR